MPNLGWIVSTWPDGVVSKILQKIEAIWKASWNIWLILDAELNPNHALMSAIDFTVSKNLLKSINCRTWITKDLESYKGLEFVIETWALFIMDFKKNYPSDLREQTDFLSVVSKH